MKSSALKIKNKTVVFTGGGTGGHLWPIVSLVHFARHELGVDAVYFGTGTDLEKRVWKKERVRQIIIPSGKKRSYFSLLNFLDPFLLA
ncbi:MAG TPA: glycosyltransferase, partial [bacterium]|nr:glycosyltransferase [bacterium]